MHHAHCTLVLPQWGPPHCCAGQSMFVQRWRARGKFTCGLLPSSCLTAACWVAAPSASSAAASTPACPDLLDTGALSVAAAAASIAVCCCVAGSASGSALMALMLPAPPCAGGSPAGVPSSPALPAPTPFCCCGTLASSATAGLLSALAALLSAFMCVPACVPACGCDSPGSWRVRCRSLIHAAGSICSSL